MNHFFDYLFRVVVVVILGQTLFFKFSGSAESVYIFSTVGVEPWGRYFAGISELIAALAMFSNKTVFYGAGMAMGIMAGAILSHFVFLGIEVQGDNGLLFILACTVLICSSYLAFIHLDKSFLKKIF